MFEKVKFRDSRLNSHSNGSVTYSTNKRTVWYDFYRTATGNHVDVIQFIDKRTQRVGWIKIPSNGSKASINITSKPWVHEMSVNRFMDLPEETITRSPHGWI